MKKTISIAFAIFATIHFAFAASSTLDAQKQKKVIERVKEYCTLMQEFSGDVEKIDNMETIFGICENSNVSVFNDLTVPSARDISANSMPLQQYMMTLTDKFENNVKTSYSGYKYVKTIVQPSPLEGFDAASYAFVKVNKQVNTGSYKAKMNLNVIVNTETMKVSSTISEDYEDPQSIYLDALTKYNEGKYEEAIPLFEKVSGLQRFSGRNRAKTMLGWIYAEQKEYQKANDLLSESSTEDPLGGVIWASKLLLNDNVPLKLINYTKGVKILKELSGTKDKDIPIMHLIAASALVDAAVDFQNFTRKVMIFDHEFERIENELINDPNTSDIFKMKGYFMRVSGDPSKEWSLEYINKAEELLKTANLSQQEYEKWDVQLSVMKASIYNLLGDTDKLSACIISMAEKPYAAGCLARLLIGSKNYAEALEFFKTASNNNDGFACYIVSLSCSPLLSESTTYGKYVKKYASDLHNREWPNLFNIDKETWWNFIMYLLSDESLNRSTTDFLMWNQKAIELGNVFAMEDRAFFEVLGDIPELKRNIPHATSLSCAAACAGLRKNFDFLTSTHYAALEIEAPNKSSYKETDTYKTLNELDKKGNGAASYLLYYDHMYLPEAKDSVKALEYLERSNDANFYGGMMEYALNLYEQKKFDQAYNIFYKLIDYPGSGAYGYLGTIEGIRENYSEALVYFLRGVEYEDDYLCYEGLSTLYRNGLGCKKDLNRALKLIKAASLFYRKNVTLDDTPTLHRLKQAEEELEQLIAEEGGNNTNSFITQLNQLLDNSISADERINKSQKLLKEIFASPKAVVKTVGSNGKTVVSTETAEDFLLRLATMPADKKLVEVFSKKDKNGKYTELTVQMK